MHNVTADQIEKNKQLIRLVKNYPQIYNHDPAQQNSGESVEEIWAKIGQELQETRKLQAFVHVWMWNVTQCLFLR
jgi:Alcohol dehydrogenase transcription factor Myb/SANT-like